MRRIVVVLFACSLPAAAAKDAGFRLNPGNPRCFLYQNRPLVLITATEHYGAVLKATLITCGTWTRSQRTV
jgi:hypothetical protein